MVQCYHSFEALFLLICLLPLLSLAGGVWTVDPESPEYLNCMNTDPGCTSYLNVDTTCIETGKSGNFTDKPDESLFLLCACPDPQYLPGLEMYAHYSPPSYTPRPPPSPNQNIRVFKKNAS